MTRSFVLVLGGDTSLGETYLRRMRRQDLALRLDTNPLSFFDALVPLISNCDFLVINLETVLLQGRRAPVYPGKAYCGSDNAALSTSVLRQLKVDAVCLANNHTMDFGAPGLRSTIEALKTAGISYFGAGADLGEAEEPFRITSGDGTIYLLGGLARRPANRDKYNCNAGCAKPGVNYFKYTKAGESDRMSLAIKNLRQKDADAFIIVYPHWGPNYRPPMQLMREASEKYAEAGADMILGHGSHNLQTCIAGDIGTTVFSLGNFVFNSPGRFISSKATPYSAVARLHLCRVDAGWRSTLKLYPILSSNGNTGYRPRPINEAEASEVATYLTAHGQEEFSKHFVLSKDELGFFFARTFVKQNTRRSVLASAQ